MALRIGVSFAPTTTAMAMIRIFFIIYCPSSVGTSSPCHVISGRRMRGSVVVARCTPRRRIASRSDPGIRIRMPMAFSNSEKKA